MYSRLFLFRFDPVQREAVEALARHAHEIMRKQQGFHSAHFFADWEGGEGGAFSVWNTREDLEGYSKDFRPLMHAASVALFLDKPKVLVSEVIPE
ncbi:MAG TPA: antibiotic biosynthesis monooxygenase [Gammaproteobacteria bacterium]